MSRPGACQGKSGVVSLRSEKRRRTTLSGLFSRCCPRPPEPRQAPVRRVGQAVVRCAVGARKGYIAGHAGQDVSDEKSGLAARARARRLRVPTPMPTKAISSACRAIRRHRMHATRGYADPAPAPPAATDVPRRRRDATADSAERSAVCESRHARPQRRCIGAAVTPHAPDGPSPGPAACGRGPTVPAGGEAPQS